MCHRRETPHRRRHQQPSAVPPRTDHLRWQRDNVEADGQKRQHADFLFLSDLRFHRLLGERRLSRNCRRRHRQLRRPEFPGADHRGVGGDTSPLGLVAARHSAHANGEAGVSSHSYEGRGGSDSPVTRPRRGRPLCLGQRKGLRSLSGCTLDHPRTQVAIHLRAEAAAINVITGRNTRPRNLHPCRAIRTLTESAPLRFACRPLAVTEAHSALRSAGRVLRCPSLALLDSPYARSVSGR
jgi:hypothetical protein